MSFLVRCALFCWWSEMWSKQLLGFETVIKVLCWCVLWFSRKVVGMKCSCVCCFSLCTGCVIRRGGESEGLLFRERVCDPFKSSGWSRSSKSLMCLTFCTCIATWIISLKRSARQVTISSSGIEGYMFVLVSVIHLISRPGYGPSLVELSK